MTWLYRVLCLAYWPLLTALLLAPDPGRLLGVTYVPGAPGGRGTHFIAFAVLAWLTLGGRWLPHAAWPLAVLLAYAGATEAMQWFVPPRSVELYDLLENFAGIAAAAALWWCFHARRRGPSP